jgi:hypothetical protein
MGLGGCTQYAKTLGSTDEGGDVLLEFDALRQMFLKYDVDEQMQLNRDELRFLIQDVSGGKVQVFTSTIGLGHGVSRARRHN